MAARLRNEAQGSDKSTKQLDLEHKVPPSARSDWLRLVLYVSGIYVSFLTWAVLQERIATTPYGPDLRVFRASNAIGVVQSLLACAAGYVFLRTTSTGTVIPKRVAVLKGYMLVALCQALSGPFSYASLQYVDYVTMLLAKSCKLLPVMAVHLLLYRRRFPVYKYIVVACVTLGVSVFSLYQPTNKAQSSSGNATRGLFLLACGLFLDGLYNTTQDEMFQKYGRSGEVSGPHMMVVLNFFTAVFGTIALVAGREQLRETAWFLANHPVVFRDIALFGACGALGQIFIFLTLERFGSLALVTTTVTRKMMSMLLSVVMFDHRLTHMQWVGVFLVFGGVAGEAAYKQLSK